MPSGIARCCARDAELAPVAHVASLGGDVGEAFRACAQAPGADGLRAVAAAWDVAEQTGAALAEVLDRVATGLRAEDEGRAEVEAALEPPRATAKLLAVLPILGLGLGTSIDAHPVGFLVGTSIGWGCLCAGTALALLGVLWVEHLASGAEV
jgi:tight adherence protein B